MPHNESKPLTYPSHIHGNLTDSASDFKNIVWPFISPQIGGGEIVPVEAVSEQNFANNILDALAGIDAWQIVGNGRGIRSIGSRIQWGVDYQSFTIRYSTPTGAETEFAKRCYAIKNPDEGMLYPHLTVQAFLDGQGGRILSVGAIRTEHLILQADKLISCGVIKDGSDKRFGIRSSLGGNKFIYMSWEYLLQSDIRNEVMTFIPA